MATLKRQKNTSTYTGSSSLKRYNQSKLYSYQYQNKSALDIINEYQKKIQNNEWLSTEDRQRYKTAIDDYTSSGNALRDVSKHYGQKYTADEEKSWNDSLSSLTSAYDEVDKYYSQWRDEDDYRGIEHWLEKPSQFDDGWQFGDGFKTVAGTLSDLGTNLGAGMLGIGEGLVDALATLGPFLAQGQYYANGGGYNIQADTAFDQSIKTSKEGSKEFVAKDLYDEDAIARMLPTALEPITGIDIDQHSVLGGKADSVVKSGGQMLGTIALQGVGVPWWLTTGATSLGSESENALRQGASLEEAAFSGLVSAGAEILTEKLFGGIKFIGGNTLDDVVLKPFVNSISNKTLRTLVSKGVDVLGEGGEEILSGMLGAVGQKLSYAKEEEWKNLFSSEDAVDALIGGVALSLGLGGASATVGNAIQNTAKGAEMQKAFGEGVGADLTAQTLELNGDNKYAQKLNSKLEGGKNLSAYQTGKILGEYNAEVGNYDIGKIRTAVESRLTELGETGDVSAIADVIARQTAGEEISLKDRAVLNKSTKANIVLTEMMPENVKGGGLANKWAEGIGTKRVNADVYNRRESSNTKPQNVTGETTPHPSSNDATFPSEQRGRQEPLAESAKLIEQAAKDKVGKIDGFTDETASVMVKDYDGSVSPSEYVTAFDEAFKLGRDNAQIKELTRLSKESGVIGRALLHAYDAGLQSRNVALEATKSENTVLQSSTESGIINTESESITNEGKTGTEGVYIRQGSERLAGTNPEGQVSRVEGGAGQNQEWREGRGRPADREAARLIDEGRGREVRVADLGILNGSKQQKVRVIDEQDYTPEIKEAVAEAKAQGLNAKVFVGDDILIEEKNGSISGVHAYVLGNQMLIRADHEYFTSKQFARHEIGHDKIAKGQVDIKAVRKRLEEKVGKEAIDSVAQTYAEAYGRTGLDADEVWEECICDSLGDMNIFTAAGLSGREGRVTDKMLAEIKAVTESETKAPTQTRGSPEGKASRETYSKDEYQNYGWARANEVLTASESEDLRSKFAAVVSKQAKYPKTKAGEYMIAIGEKVDNKIAYMQGTIDNPVITRVLEVDVYNETKLDEIRRETYALEWRGIQQEAGGIFHAYTAASFGRSGYQSRSGVQGERHNNQFGAERGRGNSKTSRVKEYVFDEDGNEVSRKYSRELDLIDYVNEKTKVDRENMTKAQLVAQARSELESMKVGTGEIMAVQKVADKLFEQYGGEASISEFRYAMYEATRLALMEEGFDAAYEVINEIAKEVAYNPKDMGGEAEMLSEIKREIRGSKLSVHEADKTSGEFDSYGGYGAFRKRLFGKVTLANDGVQVDAKYEELQNLYGKEFFPDVNTVSEQLMQIEKLMNTPLSDYMMISEEELNATADEMTMSMFARLGDIWSRAMKAIDVTANKQKAGSPRELLANALESVTTNAAEKENLAKYKKEIDGLNEQERKLWDLKRQMWEKSFKDGTKNTAEIKKLKDEILKTENRINIYDSRLLRLEATSVLRDVVEREKKAAYKAAAEKGREALHRNVEGRHKTEIRHKIKGLKGKFISMLEHPTERQYVPADLVSAMVEVCKLVDTDAPLYKPDGSVNKAQQARNEQMQRLFKLSDEYKALKNNPDPMYSGEYDEEIQEYLDDLRREFLGKPISDMTLGELNELYTTMRAIEETLRDARKLIGWGEADLVYDAGDKIIAEQKDITVKRKGKGENSTKAKFIDLSLSPLRNVKRMANYEKDSPLVKMFRELELGVRNKNKFVMKAHKSFEELTSGSNAKKYEDAIYKPYGKEYVDKEGRKFRVSKMQMMQAIMSYNRELENDKLHHVSDGGFTFADLDMLNKGKLGEAIDPKNAHSVTIGALLAEQFKAELANDKWAQDYMAASEYFFDVMAKNAINNTNMVLKHRLVATGKKYIPYEVNKDYVVREITSENDIQQTISGYGMLKDIKAGATQPLIITGLNNVLERHIEQVGNIYGLAVPIRNFNKVWNVKSSDGMTTVQEAIGRNWGNTGKSVMTQAVKDVQGARLDRQSDLYKKVKGNVISSTFMLNGSVVAKQIGSMFSATSMLRWRDPVRMIANLGYTMANHKKIAAEVDKYTASAWMRRQGLSDAELHTLTTEAKKKGLSRLVSKLPTAINPTKWIAGMDSMVALSLWKYAKQDVAKRTGLKGEALLEATAEFYDDVIEHTQSMTDALHRPEIQKRKDVVSDILGTFKTDLYQGAGQLQDALGECKADPSKENKAALARTVYANVMSACWGSLMTTVFALLRYKVNRYRDDEDDEIDAESWLKVQGADLAADLMAYAVPLVGGEAAGAFFAIMNGEKPDSVDNLTLTAVQDLIDAITAVANPAKDGEMPTEAAFNKILTKAGSVLGIPVNNVTRLIEAIRLHAEDFANGELGSFEAGLTKPNATRLYNAYIEGDAEKIEKASRLYADQKAIDTALRKALRDNDPRLEEAALARLEGDTDTYWDLFLDVVEEGKFKDELIKAAFEAEYNYHKGKKKEAEERGQEYP